MDKQISNILKQNQSIHTSLVSRKINDLPELISLTESISLDEQLKLLIDENNKLKEIVKVNKPIEVKEVKVSEVKAKEVKPKEIKVSEVKDDDSDEDAKEVQPKFSTITNMEDIKRAFFSADYELFKNLLLEHQFKMYTGEYLYASDKDGAPDYSARNLVKGMIRSFDDYRKYFMICFRCFQNQDDLSKMTYTYPSLWIVNSTDSINIIIGSVAEDYKLTEVSSENILDFLKLLEKLNEETPGLIAESYVH
jgi:hypothetical protein